jgi:hypothetical protein
VIQYQGGMKRLWWWCGAVAVVALVCGVGAVRLAQRSAFLAWVQPGVCELVTGGSPFGGVTSCLRLGRRTPPFGGPYGTVFALLETDAGTVAVRVDYHRAGGGDRFTAEAVELPVHRTPGISPDPTGKRLQEAIDRRGGVRLAGWPVRPGSG